MGSSHRRQRCGKSGFCQLHPGAGAGSAQGAFSGRDGDIDFPRAEAPGMAGLKIITSAVDFLFIAGFGEEEAAIVVPYVLGGEG